MKSLLSALCICILCSTSLAAQDSLPFDSIGYLKMETGVMKAWDEIWFIEVDKNHELKRYIPIELQEEWKVEGLEVAFNAALGKNPPHVRAMGDPIKILDIRKLDYAKPKD